MIFVLRMDFVLPAHLVNVRINLKYFEHLVFVKLSIFQTKDMLNTYNTFYQSLIG